jgi:uroporphyrin-III C-methyltransferase
MTGQLHSSKRAGRLVVLGGAHGAGRVGEAGGEVWLVGAGPGDPELLTVKALKLLQSADVVVHDRLTPRPILELAGPSARLIDVGKRKSRHTLPQDDINKLLVALALEGLKVARLKGGDPFVFGRGGEELEACRAARVPCHVVPGISAGLAAGAAAGAPLTHRGLAQAVTFVTGHAASGGEPQLDWAGLAHANQTVVVYMGLSTAAMIAARLMQAGRNGSTPVAVIEGASLDTERRIVTTLSALAEAVQGLDGPAILIIGEVAALATADEQGALGAAPPPSRGRDQGRGAAPTAGLALNTDLADSARPPAPGPSPSRGEGRTQRSRVR